jgi:putative lipoic acid-binding regulatory protein
MNFFIFSCFYGVIITESYTSIQRPNSLIQLSMTSGPAGSYFNQVPEKDDNDDDDDNGDEAIPNTPLAPNFYERPVAPFSVDKKISERGFSFQTKTSIQKSYVALGPPDKPINDVTKPEYDQNGYTVYTNEVTGEKSRVFDALVQYPCRFPLKIVGANEGTFVPDMVQLVADACHVQKVDYTTREMGRWTSVTVQAPVRDAEMLYRLYELLDQDPRVKFKF